MTESEFTAEKRYLTAIAVAKKMPSGGIISEEEYRVIDTMLLEKYRPVLSGLLSGNDLTSGKK